MRSPEVLAQYLAGYRSKGLVSVFMNWIFYSLRADLCVIGFKATRHELGLNLVVCIIFLAWMLVPIAPS